MPYEPRPHSEGIDAYQVYDWIDCFDDTNDCPKHGKHYGKYDHCLAETVHEWSMDGADDEGGDVEGPGYFALLLDTRNRENNNDNPYMAYIVENYSSGAVRVYCYDTNEEAQQEWNEYFLPEILRWNEQEDD